MSLTTMWIHGNALRVEDGGEYAFVRHRGWGTELNFNPFQDDANTHNSHIPIPTPTSVDGGSPVLTKITILFETSPTLVIFQVDVWDGDNPVAQFPSALVLDPPPNVFSGKGSHLVPDSTNQLTLDPPYPVQYGIGVSVRCRSYGDSLTLNLAAVGADFVFPNPPLIAKQQASRTAIHEQGHG